MDAAAARSISFLLSDFTAGIWFLEEHEDKQDACTQQDVAQFFHLPFSLVVNPNYLHHHFRPTALDPRGSELNIFGVCYNSISR